MAAECGAGRAPAERMLGIRPGGAGLVRDKKCSELPGVGPARYVAVRYGGLLRKVGLISAVSEPFCDTCNRVRLSATGQLHACLAYDDAIDLRRVLRSGLAGDDLVDRLVQAARGGLSNKRAGHVFSESGCGGPRKHMVSIGG